MLAAVSEEWARAADEREERLPRVGCYPIAGLIRRARRIADLSQREMARAARVAPSTVGRVESGVMAPTLEVFQRLLATAKLSLVVVDGEGHVVQPMRDIDDVRDGADRLYPSHLDTILDPLPGEWWADTYGLARPPETFWRNRARRDARRLRSQWQVRVKQFRGAPEPPDLDRIEEHRAYIDRLRSQPYTGPVLGPDDVDVDEWPEEGADRREG
jgi:transcriptional regulator with XRE-family HTH domain